MWRNMETASQQTEEKLVQSGLTEKTKESYYMSAGSVSHKKGPLMAFYDEAQAGQVHVATHNYLQMFTILACKCSYLKPEQSMPKGCPLLRVSGVSVKNAPWEGLG